jgi:predicted phosphohydrolase
MFYKICQGTSEFLSANLPNKTDFEKLTRREAQRLKASLDEAKRLKEASPEKEILVFMHFPPYWNMRESESIMALLAEYGIERVYFGHIHGNYNIEPRMHYKNIELNIVSADFIEFIPKIIRKNQIIEKIY